MLLDRTLPLTLLFCGAFGAISSAANLAYSTYLRDGFTVTAMASDTQGNLYLAGRAVTGPASGVTSAAVAKLDPRAGAFLYFAYLDSTGSDEVNAIAVDVAGNAYVVGSTVNPRFPATSVKWGALPAGRQDPRAYLTKIGPDGGVIFSVLFGGSANATAQAVALAAQGQIVISGVSGSSGFPVTPGAYAVADSKQHPFLLVLDPSASTMIFSATGIGGSSLALDRSGNIYVSGSTTLLDYPTTPDAYQTRFTPSFTCSGLCQIAFPGGQQYLSKVNPAGSQLIYSTGVNGADEFRSASVRNTGLAVDSAGNAYVTGVLDSGSYPFTVATPANSPHEFGFLTKLDPAGASILYSIPMGGGGVQIDSSGAAYVAGTVTSFNPGFSPPVTAVGVPAPLAWVPAQCLPNNVTANSEVYVMRLDPASGAVVDAQWIDGSALVATALTLASGRTWVTGLSQLADVPITPGATSPANLIPGVMPGTFLSAVDFSQPADSANGGPQIGCVADGGNLMHTGPVAPNQLLTLFGVNLGPVTGVAAPDGLDNSIDGVAVTFDGAPAQLLYISSSQINAVVPAGVAQETSTVVQISVNGVKGSARQLPVTRSNPNLLAEVSPSTNCVGSSQGFALVVANADGSRNTCTNPAKLGSIVSFYVHGIGSFPCFCFDVVFGTRSAAVVNVTPVGSLLTRVDVRVPTSSATASTISSSRITFEVHLRLDQTPIGPRPLPVINITSVSGALIVWAAP